MAPLLPPGHSIEQLLFRTAMWTTLKINVGSKVKCVEVRVTKGAIYCRFQPHSRVVVLPLWRFFLQVVHFSIPIFHLCHRLQGHGILGILARWANSTGDNRTRNCLILCNFFIPNFIVLRLVQIFHSAAVSSKCILFKNTVRSLCYTSMSIKAFFKVYWQFFDRFPVLSSFSFVSYRVEFSCGWAWIKLVSYGTLSYFSINVKMFLRFWLSRIITLFHASYQLCLHAVRATSFLW